MKAVRYYGRRDIRVETVNEPKDMRPDQLLVKPLWTGICGTDLHEYIAGPIVTPPRRTFSPPRPCRSFSATNFLPKSSTSAAT